MHKQEERPADASPGALCIYRAQRSCAWVCGALACLLLSLLATGCAPRVQALVTPFTSVRPVAQVGVLAPFEGVYRRSGYAALDAVRAAVTAAPPARTGIIPLALDTSRDAARAAAKIAASTNVAAVVGPLTPQAGAEAAPALASRAWFAPYALTSNGFVPPQDARWMVALVEAVGKAAQAQGAQRILVGGMPPELAPFLREGIGPIPTIQYWSPKASGLGAPVEPQPGDALLWLGSAVDGAAATHSVRMALPSLHIWLAPWAVDPVFFEHLAAAGGMPLASDIYSVMWTGPNYAAWADTHPHVLPTAYLMYEAAVNATAVASAAAGPQSAAAHWQALPCVVDAEGVRIPLP